ncbi:unnamed protein product [Rotaria sordida]|uniref:Reverse transcriptase domain-containing protein n=1 Tax=Rotaria sordida TaxID=392033 RepID=A0A814YBE2_9BILA|nr:unnamed protein product [Rotaria sordida]CAF1508462.1 unnamed protein product [Rotaria sordida]
MRKDKNLNGNNDDKILLNLSKYPSVLITKPNKGRGVVILDRNDYTEKLENILSDNKKFKLLNEDPTISCENALTTVLRQMKNEEYWTQQEYKYIKPVGSVPARLYGLPKVHKDNVPLRPIVSCIKSYNYKLGKFLANIIKPIRVSPYSLKHTNDFFKFIQQNSHLSRNNKMISFDIQSLFTNIPVRETIEIICNKLYCTDPKLRPFIPEDYFRKLLEFAATVNQNNAKITESYANLTMNIQTNYHIFMYDFSFFVDYLSDNVSAVELFIVNDKIKLMELNKKNLIEK